MCARAVSQQPTPQFGRQSPRYESGSFFTQLLPLVLIVIVVAALYLAREILVPIALALFLTLVLSPVVERLRKVGLGRIPAVLLVTLLAFSLLAGAGWVVGKQVASLVESLPNYQQNIHEKLQSLRPRLGGGGIWTRATQTVKAIGRQFETSTTSTSAVTSSPASMPDQAAATTVGAALGTDATPKPQPVEIVETPHRGLQLLEDLIGPLVTPVGNALIVILFVIFMLIQREDLRDRFIRLMGERQISVTTQAIDEATHGLSSYLLTQCLMNLLYGTIFGVGLALLGVPGAFFWGTLAALFRFVPYVGTWIAASLPILLSVAVFKGWMQPILVVALFLAIDITIANFIEPVVYGARTGVSSLALLISAVFWTWLWGPMGLILSTPMTVCLVVAGRYVPQLSFLDILLTGQATLSPELKLYQRLLAMDQTEANRLAAASLEAGSLHELYERLFIPTLALAEQDRHRGVLDEGRQRFIIQCMEEMIDTLSEHAEQLATPAARLVEQEQEAAPAAPSAPLPTVRVVIVPARDDADALCGAMLAQLLEGNGFEPTLLGANVSARQALLEVRDQRAPIVCISALPPFAGFQARSLARALRAGEGQLKILVALWTAQADLSKLHARMQPADAVAVNLPQVLEQLQAARSAVLVARSGQGEG